MISLQATQFQSSGCLLPFALGILDLDKGLEPQFVAILRLDSLESRHKYIRCSLPGKQQLQTSAFIHDFTRCLKHSGSSPLLSFA
jgi:hypothetical protein